MKSEGMRMAQGKNGGEMGRSDLKVGHMTFCDESARSHFKCDRSYSYMIVCV